MTVWEEYTSFNMTKMQWMQTQWIGLDSMHFFQMHKLQLSHNIY